LRGKAGGGPWSVPATLSFLLLFQRALVHREVSVPPSGNCTKQIHFSSRLFEYLRWGISFRLFLFEQFLGLGLEEDFLGDLIEPA